MISLKVIQLKTNSSIKYCKTLAWSKIVNILLFHLEYARNYVKYYRFKNNEEPQQNTSTNLLECLKLKTVTIPSVVKNGELELNITGGKAKQHSYFGKQFGNFLYI